MQWVSCCPRTATFSAYILNLSVGSSQTPRYRIAEAGLTGWGSPGIVIGVLSSLSPLVVLRNSVFAGSTGIPFSASHLTYLLVFSAANCPA